MSLSGLRYESRVRFEYDGGSSFQIFEFELHDLSVRSGAQIVKFELINSTMLQLMEPAYLRFDLSFVKMRRVGLSPASDFIDLYNLFLANESVTFLPYPISMPSLSFDVLWDSPSIEISTFRRGRQLFPRSFSLVTREAVSQIPAGFRALEMVDASALNQYPSP